METAVNTISLRYFSGEIAETERRIHASAASLQSIAGSLRGDSDAFATVKSRLEIYGRNLEALACKTGTLGSGAERIADLYLAADGGSASRGKTHPLAGPAEVCRGIRRVVSDAIWEAALVPPGVFATPFAVGKAVLEGDGAKASAKFAAGVIDSLERENREKIRNVSKIIRDKSAGLKKKFTGAVGEIIDTEPVKDPLTRGVKGALSKANFAEAIVENGISNYQEHGGLTSRFFGETAVESGIDIGKTVLLTAGIGAAVAAAGISAPAWAVPAAAAGAVVLFDAAADGIYRRVRGNPKANWKEDASDFVCDAVSGGWNKITNAVTKSASSVKWGSLSA